MTEGVKNTFLQRYASAQFISNVSRPTTDSFRTHILLKMILLWGRDSPENTHLLCKGKNGCTADLLFDWFRFGQTSKLTISIAAES